jgi:hypothetical protein
MENFNHLVKKRILDNEVEADPEKELEGRKYRKNRQPITKDHLRIWLGCYIVMFLFPALRIQDYWSVGNNKFENRWIQKRMTRQQWQMIWWNFHFNFLILLRK